MVAVLECSLCEKLRCLFSMDSIITVDGQRELYESYFCAAQSSTPKTLHGKASKLYVSSGKRLPFIKDLKRDHIDKRSNE